MLLPLTSNCETIVIMQLLDSLFVNQNNIIAEYSLTDLHKPLGISSYELKKILPKNFKSSLPSIEEIENELKNL